MPVNSLIKIVWVKMIIPKVNGWFKNKNIKDKVTIIIRIFIQRIV